MHAPAAYDLVVGNPPYVRHQSLVDPFGRPGPYGDRVAAAVDRFAPDLLLSRRADLSAAFLALGVSLLTEGGVLAFVTTNAWLDAAYGAPLGRHLLDAGLCELVERPAERTFAGADVNSLIVVVRRGDDGPGRRSVRWGARRARSRAPCSARRRSGAERCCARRRAAPLLSRGVPLSSMCSVGSYLITGNDRFFYRHDARWRSTPACLRPS